MSLIAWLDTSPDDERRMRELVRMFSDPGTLDDLGIGQVRDAFGDRLFPGSSTLHTRARYLLFVPWIFQQAARTVSGSTLLTRAQNAERRLIVTLKDAGATDGLIGRVAGEQVKTLPSTIYWAAMRRYGILCVDRAPSQLRQIDRRAALDEDGDEPPPRDWDIGVDPPPGFPREFDAGFTLEPDEARWIRERIVAKTRGSYLSFLLSDLDALADKATASAPWDHPDLAHAPAAVQATVEHARLFSLVMNGAALLYNLLVAEKYEATSGLQTVVDPVDDYRDRLDTWQNDIADNATAITEWQTSSIWTEANQTRTTPVSPGTQLFAETWISAVRNGRADRVASDNYLRGVVADRERFNKKQQSRLANPRLVATWRGASGANPLLYRWPQVSRILADIHEGVANAVG